MEYTKDPKCKLRQENPIAPQEVSARLKLKAGVSYVVVPAIKQDPRTG